MRTLDDIAHDLAVALWEMSRNTYQNSPYKGKADSLLMEYKAFKAHQDSQKGSGNRT